MSAHCDQLTLDPRRHDGGSFLRRGSFDQGDRHGAADGHMIDQVDDVPTLTRSVEVELCSRDPVQAIEKCICGKAKVSAWFHRRTLSLLDPTVE